MRDAVLRADPRLSRFDPLSRIIFFDDFDEGMQGWTALVGNYEGSLDTMLPGFAQHMQPMLSQVTHWDAGTHGAFDGTYALKIATRPKKDQRKPGPKRIESSISAVVATPSVTMCNASRHSASCSRSAM